MRICLKDRQKNELQQILAIVHYEMLREWLSDQISYQSGLCKWY